MSLWLYLTLSYFRDGKKNSQNYVPANKGCREN